MKFGAQPRYVLWTLVFLVSFSWMGVARGRWDPGEAGSDGETFFYNDPYRIAVSPSDDGWFDYESKSRFGNREDIALAIDPEDGAKAQAVRDHLARGGRFVILVCGYSSWGSPSSWERPIVNYVNDTLDAVVLQVNYRDDFSHWYIHSFKKGVDRTVSLVLKARKAGAGRIRIYGHSEGSDVTARVVAIMASPRGTRVHRRNFFSWWTGQGNPEWFEGGFAFGNPADIGIGGVTVTSYAAPPPDEQGRRGGLYRYEGDYNGFYYGGKLVLFNRVSDPATYGGISDAMQLGLSAHNYTGVFSDPDFMASFEAALDPGESPANTFEPEFGDGAFVDRQAGERFDFTDSHYIPFIPRSDGVRHCTLTVANAAPNTPGVSETAHVLVIFYDPGGRYHHDEEIVLGENGSYDIVDPLMDTGGSAAIYSSEPISAVVRYSAEDSSRFFVAAYPSEAYPSRTLYVPFVAKGWSPSGSPWRQTTGIVLFNPSDVEPGDVLVTYLNQAVDGSSAERTFRHTIPPRGSVVLSSTVLPREWRSPEGRGTLASAVIHASTPVSGMVRNRIGRVGPYSGRVYRQYMETAYRTFATRGQEKVFIPSVKKDDGPGSSIVVQNTGNEETTFTVRYYTETDGVVAERGPEVLAPRSAEVVNLPDTFPDGSSADPLGSVGSAVVEVEDQGGLGTVVAVARYEHPVHGSESQEGIPEGVYWSQKRREIIELPFIRGQRRQGNMTWDTRINVVNMGTEDDYVRIHYHEQDGTRVLTTLPKRVEPDSVVVFWGVNELPTPLPPDLFVGSGKVEGSRQKLLGASVILARKSKEVIYHHDILSGYGAWW